MLMPEPTGSKVETVLYLNPKAPGITGDYYGDNTHDHSTAIQAALDIADDPTPIAGRVVHLSGAGTVRIHTGLTLASNVTLRLDPGLRLRYDGSGAAVTFPATCRNAVLEGGELYCDQAGAVGILFEAATAESGSDVTLNVVRNMNLYGPGYNPATSTGGKSAAKPANYDAAGVNCGVKFNFYNAANKGTFFNTVRDCMIDSFDVAVWLQHSDSEASQPYSGANANTIMNNLISNYWWGIIIESDENIITGNFFHHAAGTVSTSAKNLTGASYSSGSVFVTVGSAGDNLAATYCYVYIQGATPTTLNGHFWAKYHDSTTIELLGCSYTGGTLSGGTITFEATPTEAFRLVGDQHNGTSRGANRNNLTDWGMEPGAWTESSGGSKPGFIEAGAEANIISGTLNCDFDWTIYEPDNLVLRQGCVNLLNANIYPHYSSLPVLTLNLPASATENALSVLDSDGAELSAINTDGKFEGDVVGDVTGTLTRGSSIMTSGTGFTAGKTGEQITELHSTTIAKTVWTDADTQQDLQIATLPIGAQVLAVLVDITEAFAGTGWSAATLSVDQTAGDEHFLTAFNAMSATVRGRAASELGAALADSGEHHLQGGWIPSWTLTAPVRMRLNTTGGNINAITAGTMTVYLLIRRWK